MAAKLISLLAIDQALISRVTRGDTPGPCRKAWPHGLSARQAIATLSKDALNGRLSLSVRAKLGCQRSRMSVIGRDGWKHVVDGRDRI